MHVSTAIRYVKEQMQGNVVAKDVRKNIEIHKRA